MAFEQGSNSLVYTVKGFHSLCAALVSSRSEIGPKETPDGQLIANRQSPTHRLDSQAPAGC